jgi:hypothetical protein
VVVNYHKPLEYRNGEKKGKGKMSGRMFIRLISGAREKGTRKDHRYLYQEPALVSQGEKPKT